MATAAVVRAPQSSERRVIRTPLGWLSFILDLRFSALRKILR